MGEIEAPALGNPGTAEGLLFLPPDHDTQNPVPITELFRTAVEDRSKRVAFRSQALSTTSDDADGWGLLSWEDYGRIAEELAAAFLGFGINPGDRIALLSANRWEWQVTDMAVLLAGAISVPIYPTSSTSQVGYVLAHSGARMCVLDSAGQMAKIAASLADLTTLERIVAFENHRPDSEAAGGAPWTTAWPSPKITLHQWSDVLAMGASALPRDPLQVQRHSTAIRGTDIASIVYTSGTTGPPKGVMLSHNNISATVQMIRTAIEIGPTDRFLSYLPLSHIAERVVSHFGHIASGGETWFARSVSTVGEDLIACRPTLFFAVPRVWEKIRTGLELKFAQTHGLQRVLIDKFRALADAPSDSRVATLKRAALDRTVGHQIRHGLGLDCAHGLFSGAAPIDPELLRWLAGVGLHVGEVYGQTEVCGPTTISLPGRVKIGTVGPPLPGIEVGIALDHEVLVRGPNVTPGYFLDEAATAELIDDDGWMHSGDLGDVTDDGYLRITGRKKDLMKTAGGKYIAPQELELRLRSCRFISNAVVVAEGRPYVTALLTLDAEAVSPWAVHHNKPASIEALANDPDVAAEVATQIALVNDAMSHAEQVKKWVLLPRELTLDAGEMTPTLKVIRTVVIDHFAEVIDRMYRS